MEAGLINPEDRTGGAIKSATNEVRRGFVRKVYSILSVQLMATVVIAAPFVKMGPVWATNHEQLYYLALGMMMITMCAMCCCVDKLRTYPTNYLFLFTLTVAMAIMVGMASAMYTWQSVLLAAGLTTVIFYTMTAYAWFTKTDFTGFGPYLMIAFCALLMFGLTLSIFAACGVDVEYAVLGYDFLCVLLFCWYIVYDTQLILGEWKGHQIQFEVDDYVFASLNLYLDIINLFLQLLSLFGDRK